MTNLDDARLQVDDAIATALLHRQPCHIQIACNLASIPHPTFEVRRGLRSSPSTWVPCSPLCMLPSGAKGSRSSLPGKVHVAW